ncbi:MAG: hypothetical protein CMJ06_01005 [Pelagibacterales bacterium]|nr:hypothetical protein [Pelagibacterales bacterium]OUU63444.1 MAG: hypothetical protein CBC22_00975 [Alphaproteobacteria bacterium TMED62]|tara:strand:+ start:4550 stop:4990 length:441 start_codon:yes stop_codon:yes gene_type:complete
MKLNFEKFFTGKVEANGYMIFFYPKKRKKDVKVLFSGNFKNNSLILLEKYYENNIKASSRKWHFQKFSDDHFIGNEKNIVSPFKLIIKNNSLEMNYKFKTQFKNFSFNVYVEDQMYLINKNTIINKTRISKCHITIAETLLLYKKL